MGSEVNAVVTRESAAVLEKVIIQGDLSGLSEPDRIRYYRSVCESLGLNPLTKPFDYLLLKDRGSKSQKLVLYATRTCTDQLRDIHKISVEIVDKKEEGGLFLVTARASIADGRTDTDVGAVALEEELGEWRTGHGDKRYFQGSGEFRALHGDARANAIMKAITKAKRRVTLSIVGLGWLDETEVETIPGAKVGTAINGVEPVNGNGTREAEQTVACVAEFRERLLTDDPNVEEFNALLPTVKEIKDVAARKQVWAMFLDHAKAVGWQWDDGSKSFLRPQREEAEAVA